LPTAAVDGTVNVLATESVAPGASEPMLRVQSGMSESSMNLFVEG